jgi:hypothetical protein
MTNAERFLGKVGDFDIVTGKTFGRAKSGWADAERTLGIVGDGRRSQGSLEGQDRLGER